MARRKPTSKGRRTMAKTRTVPPASESVISIIGTGMRIEGDCESAHTIRIEGAIEGTIRAAKGVVIGKGGQVTGDIHTEDAKIAGSVKGSLLVNSRLELESTAVVDGEIRTRRLKLDEGAIVNGAVAVGREEPAPVAPAAKAPGKEKQGRNGSLFASGGKRTASG